eukprot:scaffold22084_cov117-Isochrysis_galbana.AAC.2
MQRHTYTIPCAGVLCAGMLMHGHLSVTLLATWPTDCRACSAWIANYRAMMYETVKYTGRESWGRAARGGEQTRGCLQ